MNTNKLHKILNGIPFMFHQLVFKGKELGWRVIDKLRRVRKHPTYLLRHPLSRTERRLGTQRHLHAFQRAMNAHVSKPTPVQIHPSTLIVLQQEVL